MSGEHRDEAVRCWSCDSFTVACPDCGAEVWLEFRTGSVAVGQLIGFGARPDVEDYQSVRLDTPVEVNLGEQTITHAGKVWRYR
jgi:hypothetical protein